ncbi:unnamed protein product [Amaranthus hypochondriacus]
MFGFKKKTAASTATSPAHNEAETGLKGRRTSSEPMLITKEQDENLEDKSMQELETIAVNKAEETTKSVNNCLRIAEDIREDASKTLETLHQQGEQIHRTHQMAVNIDQDLTKGEKLLNSLGGMFSKPWKPKKTKNITGPLSAPDEVPKKATKEQKEKLMGSPAPKGKPGTKTPPSGQSAAMQKVEVEKEKQDDALSDLSDILGDLKGMATDMGSELDRQNKALDHLDTDIDELNSRVKGANQRARHLLSK